MKKIRRLTLIILAAAAPLSASEPAPLTFQDLENKETVERCDRRYVEVKGFLYKTKGGDYVLASSPNLKTCCTGSKENVRKQIYPTGDLPFHPSRRSVKLRGTFKVKPRKDDAGNLKKLYHLENSSLIMKESPAVPTSLMTIGAIAISSVLLCFARKRRQLSPGSTG